VSDESIDLQIDNIRIGFGDENPEPAPERTPVDRTEELTAVLEALADWIDTIECLPCYKEDGEVSEELVAAVAQILELTQVLYAEHMQLLQQMNEFIGAMALAKQEATSATKLIVANAGDMRGWIKDV
jgi:hypothetical protein